MSRLNLTTDTGAVSVSLGDSAAVVDIQTLSQTEPGPQLVVNKELICEGGAVKLSPDYNTYRVPVNAATTVAFDTSSIAGDCSFTLILDAEGATYPITLPDNFSWTVSSDLEFMGHRVYVVDVTYNDTIKAFSGDYIGAVVVPVDMDGVVVKRKYSWESGDLKVVEDLCALECNNLSLDVYIGYEDSEGNWQEDIYDYNVVVGPKGVVYGTLGCFDGTGGGAGNIELSLNGGTINSIQHGDATTLLTVTSGYLGSANFYPSYGNTVIMRGGTIGRWLSFADCEFSASISDGYVQSINMNYTSGVVSISGGTFGDVSCSYCYGDMSCNITGGTIGAVNGEDCSDMSLSIQGTAHVSEIPHSYSASFSIGGDATVDVVRAGEESSVTMSGGTIGEFYAGGNWERINLQMTGGTVGTLYVASQQSCGSVNVAGGYIGAIENSPEHPGVMYEPATPGPFSNCTIGKISTYPSSTEDSGFEVDAIIPSIGANVTVERFEFLVPYEDGYTYGTINVGANSIIKLAPSAKAYRTAGALVINADPTAQIINLEN